MPDSAQRRPAARRPFLLDTRSLGRRPGSMREFAVRAALAEPLGAGMIHVPAGAELAVDVRLEAVMEGVLASGEVTAPLAGECARCLRPITTEATAGFSELYAYEGSLTGETTDDEDALSMRGDLLDLEPALRDAIVLELPLSPRCREDCAGLCTACGEPLDDGGDHDHPLPDPRWAALRRFAGGAGTEAAAGFAAPDAGRETGQN